jgi:hypothetical protein
VPELMPINILEPKIIQGFLVFLQKYIAVPATSASVERLFSVAGKVCDVVFEISSILKL